MFPHDQDGAVLAGLKATPYGWPTASLDPGSGRRRPAPSGNDARQDQTKSRLYGFRGFSIDLLVNNAGAGHRGTLEQLSLEELSQAMELNFFGVARVTKAVLPAMREARAGRVITVTSLNGVVALPFSDAYNAAKFAVEGLMESLAAVMREFGVSISVLEPGPVRTPFFANLGGHANAVADGDPYAALINRFNTRMAALGSGGQSAESVARVIREIATDPSPALRYQSSQESRDFAARKLIDTTGRSILDATTTLLQP